MITLQATKVADKIVFSDVNMDVNIDSPLELVYNEDSINKSIVTILSTHKGSRVFRRDFGSYLGDLLFEPLDSVTSDKIKSELITAIQEWEPRILIISSSVIPDYENQQYYVQLDYRIPALANKTASFNFNLAQGK